MRLFFVTGLMAATMLTPAAVWAADIAPNINKAGGAMAADITGNVALQRDGRSERRANRGSDNRDARRAARSDNRNNRGTADVQTRSNRAETRQPQQQRSAARQQNNNVSRDTSDSRSRADVGRSNRQARRDVAERTERRADRHSNARGDRNQDGRVDRRYDRNRDGQIDRRYDRNNNDRVDRRVDSNRDGRVDRRYREARRDSKQWNRGWRNDRRYNWQQYRQSHRNYYRPGRYYSPYRSHNYRRWNIGIYLGSAFYGSQYWISDPWRYRLPPADGGYRWVRYYDDVLLIDTYNGRVVDVIYDFFY
ncbi:MAG: RcnB family protein [Parasphingorhabdus sp.]|uniref:RcnB family protein n=1 Tax=Parasphingorhabdus sp. TaxID=2709688 RepID=UPI003003289C